MPLVTALALLLCPLAHAGDDWLDDDEDQDESEDDSSASTSSSTTPTSSTTTSSTTTASSSTTASAPKAGASGLQDADDPPEDDWDVAEDRKPTTTIDVDPDDDEEVTHVQGPGEDTPTIYRAQTQAVLEATPDEEAMAWDQYLEQYPQSLYRERIAQRLEQLQAEMYNKSYGGGGATDAGAVETRFATPLLLDNLDPQSKLRMGFEWGFPNWINLYADLERALQRNLSVHGGIKHRYAGWNAEAGARYALVKSARTHTLVTGILDAHMNLTPAYPGLHPALGFGQRFDVADGLDLQLEGGADLVFNGGTYMLYVGGFNGTLHANQDVDIFLETSLYMRDLTVEQTGSFRFNVVTFGIKFALGKRDQNGMTDGKAAIGATAPYTTNYWGYHFGSVTGDYVMLMD